MNSVHATGSPEFWKDFRAFLEPEFFGELLGPAELGYEPARAVWNAMVDHRPGLIARCAAVVDVIAAVRAASAYDLYPSVRGGGHSVSGKALCEGGLTIDLSAMRRVEVDPRSALVRAEGGCLLADLDAATSEHGLVVPAGTVSRTGIGGLALGGGAGWLSRKFGLTCDNVESFEIVLADGRLVEASQHDHQDLYWALRGGGGNFGVVTRFTFRAHPFGPMMRIGASLYHPGEAEEALTTYAQIAPSLPRTIGWHASFKHWTPPYSFLPDHLVGERLLMLLSMWLGDPDDPRAADTVARLNAVGHPCHQVTGVLPFGAGVQKILDAEVPDGKRYYTREAHLLGLSASAINRLVAFWRNTEIDGQIILQHMGGAIQDVHESDAAFANRNYPWWLMMLHDWDDPRSDADNIADIRAVVADLGDVVGAGGYINMLNYDEMDRVVESFGGTAKYERLAQIKGKYDPQNRFRVNCNIEPQSATVAP